MSDEHCWIGELNGKHGWFPAKFVQLVDERSKSYSLAGDDSINENISDLVREKLATCMKAIFEHGLRKTSSVLGKKMNFFFFNLSIYILDTHLSYHNSQ